MSALDHNSKCSFFQYLCINALYPEFEVFNEFSTETFVPAMGMDALEHTHPVEVPLKDASEISQVFDKITYCKGASVIYMLHQYIGAESFRNGIREYIQHFAYGNADSEDLWKFMTKSSGIDVGELMNSWIRELGFPVVNVTTRRTAESEESGKITLRLTQERFCGGQSSMHGINPMIWSIPVQGIYMKGGLTLEKFDLLFDKKSTDIELEGVDLNDPDCWIKLNPRLTGFYRVHYSEDLFQNLFSNLSSPHLTSVDRMGLFDDQVAMVQTESGSTVRLLKMARHFSEYERSYTVWRAVIGILHLIRSLTWETEEVAEMLDNFCQGILRPFLDELGFIPLANESTNDRCV
jgi:puromycin-sensitive aminopeptidase